MHNSYKTAYYQQKSMAKKRGIDFLLTYDQWLTIWETSGKLPQRGRGKGKYCMARHNDVGPYAINNISIQLNEKNVSDGNKDRWKNKFVSDETKIKLKIARANQTNVGYDKTIYSCPTCNKVIRSKSNLVQHVRAKH